LAEREEPATTGALRRALSFLRSYRRESIGAALALMLVSGANLLAPLLVGRAIDDGIAPRKPDVLFLVVGGLVGVALVRGLFTFLQGYLAERTSQGVAYDLRDALFERIERLSFSYYDRVQTGQLVQRITNDVEQIRSFAGSGVVQLANAVVMLIGAAALLFYLDPQLALVAMAVVPLIALLLIRFVRLIRPLFREVQQTLGQLNSVLQEDLSGVRVIRAFAREDYETARYGAVNDDLLSRNLQTTRVFSNNFPFVFLFANLGTLAIIWFGGWQIINDRLSIGELVAFNTLLGFMLFPILTIGFLSASISRAGASATRVFEILDAPLEVTDKPDAYPLPPIHCRVEFDDVSFRYPGSEREILNGINFVAEPGQTVAILGTTGSGKSTLVNLLPRFYDVSGGAARLDGHDVRDVTLSSLRSQIGIVLQEARLFSGSVRDNIAFGKPDATDEEVRAAADAAQAGDFVGRLPDGYQTVIGERGASGSPAGSGSGSRSRVRSWWTRGS